MKVAIFCRSYHQNYKPAFQQLFEKLDGFKISYQVYVEFAKVIKEKYKLSISPSGEFSSFETLDEDCDYFFSIGGDGTILDAITYIRNRGIPIIGINIGRLGFLANISKEGIDDAINAIYTNQVYTDSRSLIQLIDGKRFFGDFCYALNECTIQKVGTALISIHTHMDGNFLNAYWADGLIISTPTGSTAYSMSAGGPILKPDCQNFILSPIAPHNLTMRPLVIPDDGELKLRINGRTNRYLVSMDQRSVEMDHEYELLLRKADFTIDMVHLKDQDFFSTLRNKLMWGMDKRN